MSQYMARVACILSILVIGVVYPSSARAFDFIDLFTGDTYCRDELTVDLNCGGALQTFAGIRLVVDAGIGGAPVSSNFDGLLILPNVGAEFAILGGWLTAQALYLMPTEVAFSERTEALTASSDRRVRIASGFALTFTFFSGLLSVGGTALVYTQDSFSNAGENPTEVAFLVTANPVALTRLIAALIDAGQ